MSKQLLLILLAMVFFASCGKDDSMTDNPPFSIAYFELEFFFTQDDNDLIKLSWSDLSGFDSIQGSAIIYSLDSIPMDYFPPVQGPIALPFSANNRVI